MGINMGGLMVHMTVLGTRQKPFNFTHRINQLSFYSEDTDLSYTIQPLDGHLSNSKSNYFTYFLEVVGVKFSDNPKEKWYQFSVTDTSHSSESNEKAGLVFKYDFSPVLVNIDPSSHYSLPLFLVRVCSIIGGVRS